MYCITLTEIKEFLCEKAIRLNEVNIVFNKRERACRQNKRKLNSLYTGQTQCNESCNTISHKYLSRIIYHPYSVLLLFIAICHFIADFYIVLIQRNHRFSENTRRQIFIANTLRSDLWILFKKMCNKNIIWGGGEHISMAYQPTVGFTFTCREIKNNYRRQVRNNMGSA